MANLKVRLKRRNGTAFDDLFPEVAATSLLQSDGTALSTFSAEVLQQAHNASNTTFVTGDADGGLNLRTASSVRSDFGIAASTHTQAQSTINACYIVENGLNVYKANRGFGSDFGPDDESVCETAACSLSQYNNQTDCVLNGGTWWAGGTWTNLSTALGYKADLDSNNKILFSQLPAGVDVKAMKFVGVTGNLGTISSAATLSSKFSQLDGLGTSALNQKLGDYLIATNDTTNKYIAENTSSTGDSYEFILATSAADDDQPSGSNVVIEAGDRIVFTNYTGSTSGSFTFFFAVINSAQSFGASQSKGIVELSSTGQTLDDFDTGTTNRYERVVDEASLRSAMKDQRKVIEFTGNNQGRIKYWASASGNLPTSLVADGEYALVGTGTTKAIWTYSSQLSAWGATNTSVTFPANASGIPSGTFEENDVVYYDAGQTEYLYLSGTSGNSERLAVASNTSTSTILPADGDLVYYISP
jgi:hypothetical protein